MDGGNADMARGPAPGDRNAALALALAFLVFSIFALERPVLAGSDVRSCVEKFKRTRERMTPQCEAMDSSSWIRAALIVGDEEEAEIGLILTKGLGGACTDADDDVTCLARLDAIAGWTLEDAWRAAEEQVPYVRQCFRYRTEALREARAAKDYQRIELFQAHRPCCAERERGLRENPTDIFAVPFCPSPAPTASSQTKATAMPTQWRDWAGLAFWIPITIAKVVFLVFTVRAIIRRTPYGLWWRRSWAKILIVVGTGISARELGFHYYLSRLDPAMFAIGAVMIVAGALNLKRPKATTSTTDKPSAEGRDADQTPE